MTSQAITETKLQPCPFCANVDLVIDDETMDFSSVYCPRCRCVGPEGDGDVPKATNAWNKRHEQAQSARLDPHHAKVRLMLANLAGAVSALAVAINNAGGYRVFDPDRSEPIHRAMAALTNAFDEAMALPPVTANENGD